MRPVNTNMSYLFDLSAKYLKTGKTNNTAASSSTASPTVTSDVENDPLTDAEVSLAKAHVLNLEFNSLLQQFFNSKGNDEKFEATKALREASAYRKENSCLFTDEIKKEYAFQRHGITLITSEDFKADMERLNKNFGLESFNLPQQGYSIDVAANTITVGKGSKIPMDGYHLWVFDYKVGAVENGTQPPSDLGDVPLFSNTESPYIRVLDRLLGATSSGNASWDDDPEMNGVTLDFLRKLGIDTSRDFKINDTAFEVKDGLIQTKGYTAPQQTQPIGLEGLNKLALKAYEQNLL